MPEQDTLVLLPTYNERENLESILARIRTAVPEADVLVIDDASPDGTGRIADELAARDPRVRVLHRPAKQGLGRAYLAGFRVALDGGYLLVVEIDADGSHDPAELPQLIDAARAGADLAIGSRWVAGGNVSHGPQGRQLLSRAGNAYARLMLRSSIRDITAGFRVYRVSALRGLDLGSVSSQGYCFQIELAWRLERTGHRIEERPITFVKRVRGRSKMRLAIIAEALLRVTAWGVAANLRPKTAR